MNKAELLNHAKAIAKIEHEIGMIEYSDNAYMKKHYQSTYDFRMSEILVESIPTASLRYFIKEAIDQYSSMTGPSYDLFWKKLKEHGLPYEPKDVLEGIFKRGRLKDEIEYEFVIDNLVLWQQEGKITETQRDSLNEMIAAFEAKGGR